MPYSPGCLADQELGGGQGAVRRSSRGWWRGRSARSSRPACRRRSCARPDCRRRGWRGSRFRRAGAGRAGPRGRGGAAVWPIAPAMISPNFRAVPLGASSLKRWCRSRISTSAPDGWSWPAPWRPSRPASSSGSPPGSCWATRAAESSRGRRAELARAARARGPVVATTSGIFLLPGTCSTIAAVAGGHGEIDHHVDGRRRAWPTAARPAGRRRPACRRLRPAADARRVRGRRRASSSGSARGQRDQPLAHAAGGAVNGDAKWP